MDPEQSTNIRNLNRSVVAQHPEISIKKAKIFENFDKSLRKTKIICTIG
jgi:hypothetical protein